MPSKLVIGLTTLIGFAACCGAETACGKDNAPPHWDPHKTRVFIVCLAKFKGEKKSSFTMHDRLDGRLVEVLKKRGVPADHIVFLQDPHAAADHIQSAFTAFLRKSQPG